MQIYIFYKIWRRENGEIIIKRVDTWTPIFMQAFILLKIRQNKEVMALCHDLTYRSYDITVCA